MASGESIELDGDYPFSDELRDDVVDVMYRVWEQLHALLHDSFRYDRLLGGYVWVDVTKTLPRLLASIHEAADQMIGTAQDAHAVADELERRARAELARDRTWRR